MTTKHPNPLRLALVAAACTALVGCADFSGISAQSQLRDAASLGLDAQATQNPAAADARWWLAYGDGELNRLIEQAEQGSPSLRLAQARLHGALAGTELAESADRPQLNASLDASRQLYTKNGMVPSPIAGTIRDTAALQLGASWELDLFGKNRAALEAALGTARAAEVDSIAARVLLESTVTRSYLRLRALSSQLEVAQRALQQREETLSLVKQRIEAGLDSQLELRQAEAALPEARRQIEALQEQVTLARHALAALIGQPHAEPLATVPTLAGVKPLATPVALPADLLGRRPDVLAARWRVEAAMGDAANAKAQFYPNINLTAFAGFSSIGFDRLLESGSQQWGVGPAIRLPLFDNGRLRANLRGKTANLDQAVENYNATVIEAVRETLDQISSLQAIVKQQAEQQQAQQAAEAAYALARQRYEAGLGNYLQVLSAETGVLEQRRLAVDLQARLLDTQVVLVRALGGGYRTEPPRPQATTGETALAAAPDVLLAHATARQ
jgi:NodT family efflux transporter outer membrane factor (OMF) lipoprotein